MTNGVVASFYVGVFFLVLSYRCSTVLQFLKANNKISAFFWFGFGWALYYTRFSGSMQAYEFVHMRTNIRTITRQWLVILVRDGSQFSTSNDGK